jgi:glycosyltransferase involved in cell wall biosynthesis
MPSRPVTVVIPTYNRARRLPDTIASVLAQTVSPLEVLVVDDGSSDGTREVCASYSAPLRYIWRPNGGVSAARNTGMREARGEFIAFLDADDVWEPMKLEVQLALHDAHPELGWSFTNHVTTDADSRPLPGVQGFRRDFPAFTETGADPDEYFGSALERDDLCSGGTQHAIYTGDAFALLFSGNVAFPSSVVMRRSLADRAGFWDEDLRCAVDTEYFHRLAAAAPVGIVMTPLFRWRRGEANTIVSSGNMTQLVQNAQLSLERAATLRELSPDARRRYAEGKRRLLLRLAYMQLSNCEGDTARGTLRRARQAGAPVTHRFAALFAATLLPHAVLRGLHRAKRLVQR